ncbi:MAG: chloride channel protein [Candidatus Heimdallarchaeaceae archaeon]
MKQFEITLPPYAKKWLVLDLLGAITGVVGGLGAVLFRYAIKYTNIVFFKYLLPFVSIYVGREETSFIGLPSLEATSRIVLFGSGVGYNLGLILLPLLGGLIIGPIIMRFAPETKGHGVPEVMEAVALNEGNIRKRVAFMKVGVSAITIGTGGSAGREGPIAQIGATIGSFLGQAFKLDPRHKRLLVVCGLAAGIAGTFNAPLGGALFGMEILLRGIGLFNAMPVVIASIVGVAVSTSFLGQQPAFIVQNIGTWHPTELPLYIILGLIFGVLSVIWVKVFYGFETIFAKIKIPNSLKPALGGLFAGVLLMFYPSFGIGGVGYEGIDLALASFFPIYLLFILGILKILATSFSVGSGGSGGIFAPSLFIGTMFGTAFGMIFNLAFPALVTNPITYGLAGMGAIFAGAAQAPINVILMIPEMSNDYFLIPPIMITSFISFFVAWLFLKGSSIYTIKLERRGIKLKMGMPFQLDLITVEEIMSKQIVTLETSMPVSILELYYEEYGHTGYPVLSDGKLEGIVTISDLQKIPIEKRSSVKVKEIAKNNLISAFPDETASKALEKMNQAKVGRIVVVDRKDNKKLIGIITKTDILNAYELAAKKGVEQA